MPILPDIGVAGPFLNQFRSKLEQNAITRLLSSLDWPDSFS